MRTYPKLKRPKQEEKETGSTNFVGGLNKFVSDNHIQDTEFSDVLNAKITEDGVITKRDGQVLKLTQGSRIMGSTAFYPSSGTKYLVFTSGQALYQTTDLTTATRIGGATQYTNDLRTNYAQYNDMLYVCNGTDALTKTDGVTLTTFTAIANPTVALTLATAGTAGTTTYGYRYSWVSNTGETAVGAEATIATGPASLTDVNFVNVSLNTTTPANTVGLNLYGRFAGKETFLTSLAFPAGTVVNAIIFADKGTASGIPLFAQSPFYGPPSGNNTAGIIGKYCKIYHSTLFIAGDPSNKSRLYYSGQKFTQTALTVDSFLPSDGGGFIEVNRNGDDGAITGMEIWQDKLIVTKERSIWQFTFDASGNPIVASIQPLHGCVDQRTLVTVENDLMMLSQISGKFAIMTLGFEPNFFNIIRTNSISIKISPLFDGVNASQIANSSAVYYDFKYILSVPEGTSTTNSVCFAFDRRYNAHLGRWDSITANNFTKFISSTGAQILLYGSDNSGKLIQLGTGTDDMGTAISFSLTTKNFNYQAFYVSKFYIDAFFQFRNLSGTVSLLTILEDNTGGSSTLSTNTISQNVGSRGWGVGADWGLGLGWGNTSGSSASVSSSSIPIRHPIAKIGRGVKFQVTNSGVSDQLGVMACVVRALIFSPYYFPQSLTVTDNITTGVITTQSGLPITT